MPYIDSAQGQGVSRRAISLWQAGRLSEGLGTDTDPVCPCSLLIRVIPPGCPTRRLWGIFTGQCSMELWPVNCAIRCSGTTVEPCRLHRVRGCQVWLPRAVHAQWAEVRTLHFFPGRGCTHSAHTLSLCSGSSTPGSALLPYGFGSAGRCRSCCYTDPVTGQRASCLRELSPTRYS